MSSLTVAVNTDFSGQVLNGLDQVTFTNLEPRIFTNATFSAAQFDNVQIFDNITFTGSIGRNGVIINGSSLSAGSWSFANWSAADLVTINGTAGADSFGGTLVADRINGMEGDDEIVGGLGLDRMFGGGGDDIIRYTTASELVNGEVADGGAGTGDLLVLEGTQETAYDFTGSTVTGIEALQFEGGGKAAFAGTQIGGAAITQVIGNLNLNRLIVTGQAIDISAVTFTDWDDSTDDISLRGSTTLSSAVTGSDRKETISGGIAADTLSGRGGDDDISGGGGADVMTGGLGDDRFTFAKTSDMADGETVNGGGGIDTLAIASGSGHELWRLALSSVEKLSFGMFSGDLALSGTQIGGQAGLINIVTASLGVHALTVLGPSVNLGGVTFTGWTKFDSVIIEGKSDAANSLTGSAMADTISGGAMDDVIVGGKGADIIQGGLGKDTMTGGNQGDTYVYHDAAESLANATRDRITDFSIGNDVIDLSAIDAVAGGEDDAFAFRGQQAFSGAGQIRYYVTPGGSTVIEGDIDGDGTADFQIGLTGNLALTVDEFVL